MTEFLLHLGWLTLSISSVILLILLFNRIFGGKFSARSRYIVWTVVVLSLCIGAGLYRLPALFTVEVAVPSLLEEASAVPLNPPATTDTKPPVTNAPSTMIPTNPITPHTNHTTASDANDAPPLDATLPNEPQEGIVPAVPGISPKESFAVDIPTLIFGIWAFGAILYFSFNMAVYSRSTHRYARSKKICDAETGGLFRSLCRRYKIKRIPRLYVCAAVGSPVLYGYTKPTILLPDIKLSPNSLVGVLTHEVTHYRRGDIWVKLLCLLAESLYWFHPLVHVATARCNAEMELSCDEAVLAGMDEDVRRSYGNVMLEIVKHCARKRSTLTTQYSPHKNAVKERILNILDMTKKKYGWVMIAVTLVLCVVAGTIIGCDVKNEDNNKTENGEIEKIIDSITYVNFSSDNADDCFIPVSFIKDGVQLITGDLGLQGDVLAGAPKADTLKKANGIASDGEWNFFPYEVKHTEYTYDNQPENKEWTDYFRTMLAKDAPIIIADVYSLEQHGVQIDVVTASNIVMTGDASTLYNIGDTYAKPNIPLPETTTIYCMSVVFVEGKAPTELYRLTKSFLTVNDGSGISYNPATYTGAFQQIYSSLQYTANGKVEHCPLYCNMNGELTLRSFRNKPAFTLVDIDGDGKVELAQYIDQGSSDMTIGIIYEYTNNGYVRQASIQEGANAYKYDVVLSDGSIKTLTMTDGYDPVVYAEDYTIQLDDTDTPNHVVLHKVSGGTGIFVNRPYVLDGTTGERIPVTPVDEIIEKYIEISANDEVWIIRIAGKEYPIAKSQFSDYPPDQICEMPRLDCIQHFTVVNNRLLCKVGIFCAGNGTGFAEENIYIRYGYEAGKIVPVEVSVQKGNTYMPQEYKSDYIHVEAISALPQDPSEAWKIYDPMMSPIYYFFDNGLMYYCRYEYNGEHYEKNTLFLPEGYTNGEIFYVRGTGGSASMYIIVKTDQGYLRYDSSVSHCPDEIYSVTELTEDELEYEKSCMANDQMWVTPDSTEVFDPEAYAELIPGGSTHYEFYHQLMPAPAQTYLYFCSVRTLNSLGTEYTDDPPRDFKVYAKQADDNILYSVEATLPDDLEYDSVLPVLAIHGGGSMECRFFLRLTNGIEVFYVSFDNFEWTDDYLSFKYGGIVSDDELSELALQ